VPTVMCKTIRNSVDVGLRLPVRSILLGEFIRSVGIGFLGTLFLFGCATTVPPTEHFATGRSTSTRADRATIDPDCPYLRVQVVPSHVMDTTWDLELIHKIRQESLANRLRRHLDQVGFKTVRETGSLPNWVLYSNSQELPDERIVWSLSMQKVPTITDESLLLFQRFSAFSSRDRPVEFSSTSYLKIVWHHEIDDLMVEITEDLAKLWLPYARNQCADINGTLLEEEAKIEKIREKLTKEMERVRRLRREQEKHLKIEVEQ
jgi:hypothetical protein